MDVNAIWSFPWIRAVPVLSRILRGFFRRQALGDEGRIGAHRGELSAASVPELVSAKLPLHVRNVSLRRGIIPWAQRHAWLLNVFLRRTVRISRRRCGRGWTGRDKK